MVVDDVDAGLWERKIFMLRQNVCQDFGLDWEGIHHVEI